MQDPNIETQGMGDRNLQKVKSSDSFGQSTQPIKPEYALDPR